MYRQLIGNCAKLLLIFVLIFTFIFVNRHVRFITEKQSTQTPAEAEQTITQLVINKLNYTTVNKLPSRALLKDFCVFSPKCKIPKLNPFAADIMSLFNPPEFKECTNQPDLVRLTFDRQKRQYRVHIDESWPALFTNISNYECTYKEITRAQNDSLVWVSEPMNFPQNWLVPRHMQGIIVECHELSNVSRVLQRDAFAFIQYPTDRNDRVDEKRSKTHPNVIVLGIDAMSQFNFHRTMPRTAQFVRQAGWYEMLGYNKIGDNTLPNILALLTGRTAKQWKYYCDVRRPGCLDAFTYLWNHFHSAGYLTAFAEDVTTINTFNYFLPGFMRQPVDYYLRPFLQAIEQTMDVVNRFGFEYCVGRRQSYRYVLDYCLQMIQRFVQETPKPIFGFFWMNSFSHDEFSSAASVDGDFVGYLERFQELGLFDRSIVILLSDHGQRYGPLMDLPSSFLEERLPMLHIYLPPWFRQKYPEVAHALDHNRRRLSTPYDLHLTFKHMLQLLHPQLSFFDGPNCAACQSLLHPLPENRDCLEASIPVHWCCCELFQQVPITEALEDLARLLVYRMNQYLVKKNYEKQCYHLNLRKLLIAERQQFIDDQGLEVPPPNGLQSYRFKFTTKPNGALFRATLLASKDSSYVQIKEEFITRLNSYREDAYCVRDRTVKKFCSCLENQGLASQVENVEETTMNIVYR